LKLTGLSEGKLLFWLGRLNAFGFTIKTEHGYNLVSAGLDALSLHSYVTRNLISGMGRSVGMGKESDVFETINEAGLKYVIKFYRIGRISFRATRIKRSYSRTESQHHWLEINIHAAEKEAEGLQIARRVGVKTPDLIARDRHTVLMNEIEGVMLHVCHREDVERPKELYSKILENARKAYVKGGIINGDLSEYNVLYDGIDPWIIDWPQFVKKDHPNAKLLLDHDIKNIVSFFKKKFGMRLSEKKALKYVSSESEDLN
jgi:RIO kinase 2